MRRVAVVALLLGSLAAGCGTSGPARLAPLAAAPLPADYDEQLETWKRERAEGLQREEGWLSLAGLHWLEPGANSVGNDPEATVRLEADGVPADVGTMHLDDELRVRFVSAAGAEVTLANGESEGARVGERVLGDDNSDALDKLRAGRLLFYVIRRGERVGVRVKDPQHPNRLEFAGLDFYPVDLSLRVGGVYRPHDEPKMLNVPSVIGTSSEQASHGTIEFVLDGVLHTLAPLTSGPDDTEPWVVFKDGTAGRETYGAGRFLVAERDGEQVTLDFNRAYNPPCAYTPFATCPLPPPGNILTVAIAAGEKTYGGSH